MKIKLSLLILLALLTPSVSFGAIAFDNSATNNIVAISTGVSITISSSPNAYLLCEAYEDADVTVTTTVIKGGVATNMTEIPSMKVTFAAPQAGQITRFFWLQSPDSGTNRVTSTRPSSGQNGVTCGDYIGVAQVAPEANATNTITGATRISATSTSISDNAWAVAGLRNNSGTTITGDASTTIRINSNPNGDAWVDSGSAISPPAQFTLSVTLVTDSNQKEISMVIIAPFVAASAVTTVPQRVVWWGD